MEKVRVRFAPSPTGGLHVGGLRTALYNYLFAKKHGGEFYVRIEDTDQNRFVEGAEKYIFDALAWLGINPDETIGKNEKFGPYRQSERTELYNAQIQYLLDTGRAYYAFDTVEELKNLRDTVPFFKYDHIHRSELNNSTNPNVNTAENLKNNVPYTIRFLNIPGELIVLHDEIRGRVEFDTTDLDDKILMKADGLPTYHLASVVDDHFMETSHVIRGEEWLPSLPTHIALYNAFGWDAPKFAHLPLILKPNGKGKLSKRDAIDGGFPILPLQWNDLKGYKEDGYLSTALINFMATTSWNNKDNREIYSLTELIDVFDLGNISKAGAKYDVSKLNWFNTHYLSELKPSQLLLGYIRFLRNHITLPIEDNDKVLQVITLTKDRFHTINDLYIDNMYFFREPAFDQDEVAIFTDEDSLEHLNFLLDNIESDSDLKSTINTYCKTYNFKMKTVMQLLRYAVVGSLSGPDIQDIIAIIGKQETKQRIKNLITNGIL